MKISIWGLAVLSAAAFGAACSDASPTLAKKPRATPVASSPSPPASAPATPQGERPPVLTLTPVAAQQVQQVMQEQGYEGYYLRVGVKPGGCNGYLYELGFDQNVNPAEDIVEESQGVRVAVDRRSALFLQGSSLDYLTLDGRAGFQFDNPNAVKPTP